jgi:hypothetical protein
MKILPILSFLLLAFSGFSQTGKLTVSIYDFDAYYKNSYNDTNYLNIQLSNGKTSLKRTMILEWENGEISIDSLLPDDYLLSIRNTKADSLLLYQCRFTIIKNKETNLNIDLNPEEEHHFIDEETNEVINDVIVEDRVESQFDVGYFDNNWVENNPKLTQSYSLATSVCYWSSFSKHLGILLGCGFGINHSSISKDTVYFNTPQFKKQYEYYNYMYLSPEFKIRFTLKNQQHDYDFFVKGLILDIGARYNLPLAFKHVGRFTGSTKLIERGLHQYSDLRFFASIGRAPAMVFFEYRPFDFILGNYPELPKYTIGLKFVIHG